MLMRYFWPKPTWKRARHTAQFDLEIVMWQTPCSKKLACFHLQLFPWTTLAQAICFILIRGLKMLFFSRLPKYDKQPLCSSPLFTACSMLCCKIFTVKLSTMLATRPAFTVWWHSPSVYAPSAPHQCLLAVGLGNRPTSRDLPEQFKCPASFQAWLQTRVKFFFFIHCLAKAPPKVFEFQLGMTSEGKKSATASSFSSWAGCLFPRLIECREQGTVAQNPGTRGCYVSLQPQTLKALGLKKLGGKLMSVSMPGWRSQLFSTLQGITY